MRKRNRAIVAMVATAGFALAASLPAGAQPVQRFYRPYDYRYAEPNVYVLPAPACQPMCSQDFAPCDPLPFKLADGRCAGIVTR